MAKSSSSTLFPFQQQARARATEEHLIPDTHLPSEPGWVEYACWENEDDPVEYLAGTWKVPEPPVNNKGQTIFVHQALQSGTGSDLLILSVTIQWGESAAGGGPYWGMTCFAAKGNDVYTGPLVRLSPGDEVRGVFYHGLRMGAPCWECSASSNGQTTELNLVNMAGAPMILDVFGAALEGYCNEAMDCDDYPNSQMTSFKDLEVRTAASATPTWSPTVVVEGCGRKVEVLSPKQVDLYYR